MKASSFCYLPWINLSTDVNGSLRPCCKFAQPDPKNEFQLPNMKDGNLDVLWNHDGFQNLRKAFLQGKKPKECHACWDEEDSGVQSFRLAFIENKQILINDDESFEPIATQSPKAIDFKLNNVCNLKCRICGPQASSFFLKEYKERFGKTIEGSDYWLSDKIVDTPNEDVIKDWSNNLQHLEITGGEPMSSPENTKILELLVSSGKANNITLLLNTNCTLFNKKLINLLSHFKKVDICLSIDDIEDRLEYERYPTKWSLLLENLNLYIELTKKYSNITINLCPTVSIFNIYYLPEYLEWSDKLGINLYFNLLHTDPCYSIKNLPFRLKQIVFTKLTDPRFDLIKNFLNLPSENLIDEFKRQVFDLDKHRKQSFEKTFGIWGKLITEYIDE